MDEPVRGAASATRLTRVRKARTPRWRTVLKSRVKAKYAHRWTSPAATRRRARRWTALAGALVGSPFVALAVTAVGLFPAGAAIAPAMTAGPAGLLLAHRSEQGAVAPAPLRNPSDLADTDR